MVDVGRRAWYTPRNRLEPALPTALTGTERTLVSVEKPAVFPREHKDASGVHRILEAPHDRNIQVASHS